jgi:hypothetical protein
VVQDTLIPALHMIEALLARCERGKDSRSLATEVEVIMESVEAAHSELSHNAESEKRTARLLENEIGSNVKLHEQIKELQQQIKELQRQVDVLSKPERRPILLAPCLSRKVPYSARAILQSSALSSD